MMRQPDPEKPTPEAEDHPTPSLSRRGLLRGSTAAAAGLAITRYGASDASGAVLGGPLSVPSWMQQPGAPVNAHPYGVPSPYEKPVVRKRDEKTPTDLSSWSFTPLQDLHGMIVPNGLFYERDHAGVPAIDPAAHRLLIDGLVDRPMVFTLADLKRLPAVSAIHFMECSGNSGTEWNKPTGKTVQKTHGLLSCAEWTGVRLETVLGATGVRRQAGWFVAEGADAAAMDRSIPLAEALRIGALLAYAQNGEALRPEQGFPLRLVLPGFEGNTNVKWLRHIELRRGPAMSKEETAYYTQLLPNGKARAFNFVMEAKSVITFPSAGESLPERGFYEIRGLAWSGNGRVLEVDVSVDGGRNWQRAELQEPVLTRALTRFRLPWRWSGGSVVLQSRATDDTGYVQPTRQELLAYRGAASHYHYNAIQSWEVQPNGDIINVHA